MTSILLSVLLVTGSQKAPDELTVEGRWKDGKLEVRLEKGAWVSPGKELLDQLRAAGAKDETPLLLSMPADVPSDPVKALIDLLKDAKYSKVEFEATVFVAGRPGRRPERRPGTPLRIEIAGTGITVDQTTCRGRVALRKALGVEAAKEADPQVRSLSPRPVTLWADGKVPYGLVVEVGVVCEEAGFFKIAYDGALDPALQPPDPGTAPVRANHNDKTPLLARVGVRLTDGKLQLRIDRRGWVDTEQAWMEQVRKVKASVQTGFQFDPDGDVPFSAVRRLRSLLETWGFQDFSYMAPGFLLEGAVDAAPVGVEEAEQWARTVDAEVLRGALYPDELLRRAIGSVRLSVGVRVSVGRMAEPSIVLGESPELRFIALEGSRPLFRLFLPGRMDYVGLVLGRVEGKLRVVDLYSMATGKTLSDIVRANYLSEPASIEVLNTLKAPTPGDLARCAGRAGEMLTFHMDGQPKEALAFWRKNVGALKRSDVAHRIRMNIAQTVGVPEYLQALEDFDLALPSHPAQTFLRVERFILLREREKGLAAIDALGKVAQGDAFLDVLRAQLNLVTNDLPAARTFAERAVAAEPTLDRAWWVAITITLAQKDFAATCTLLTNAEKALKITIGDPNENPAYAEFVKSPEYRRWAESRKN